MIELVAKDTKSHRRWRRKLVPGHPLVIGRTTERWAVDWDSQISSRHAELRWNGTEMLVTKNVDASNPIFFEGHQRDAFVLPVGKHFVIGHTDFLLVNIEVTMAGDAAVPRTEITLDHKKLRAATFQSSGDRIRVLSELATQITAATSDEELASKTLEVILQGIPHANTAALIQREELEDEAQSTHSPSSLQFEKLDTRLAPEVEFRPSHRLIHQALDLEQCVIHVWNRVEDDHFTQDINSDWAFCIPVLGQQKNTAIYVSGTQPSTSQTLSEVQTLQDDMKFAELATATFGNLSNSRRLMQRQAALQQFFSPSVQEFLQHGEANQLLAPREVDITVLFCDLRGFSQASEKHSDDLMHVLNKVSRALSVMTNAILHHGGVIGDFHGDAAMGFWGWPISQEGAELAACKAAIEIQQHFSKETKLDDQTDLGFQVGIGIASGKAVAGKIGSEDQVKVTAFGPPVNTASRLESMTKTLQLPILIDQQTASKAMPFPTGYPANLSPVATVLPYGMEAPVAIHSLQGKLLSPLEQKQAPVYQQALGYFESAQFSLATEQLQALPEDYPARHFLEQQVAKYQKETPDNWSGVIRLDRK
ncbi:MAG: adenylate/guanylate cyclase domain-containing protein [Pirellulales bacterium]